MRHYYHINTGTAFPWFTQKKIDTEGIAVAGL